MNRGTEDKMPTGTMAGMPQVLLAHHLKQLKLPAVLREHEKLAMNAHATGLIIADTCCGSSNLS